MGLESATYLNGLVNTNPGATDNVSQGDDHLRLIKSVLKNSFPSVDAAVNAIHTSASAPSTSISAGLIWFDTTNNLIKIRNEANDAWITLPISPVTSNTVDIDGGSIDGTAIGAASASTGKFSSVNIAGDGATVTGIKDEDDMASDSAVKLATQQSIKAYVDSQVTAQDLDVISDSGNIDIDLDSESFTIAGGEGIDTSATGTTLTIAGEDASTSNKGVASFNSANFAASSGEITIKDGGIANAELADMAANTVKVRDANSSGVPSDKTVGNGEILIGDGTGFTAAAPSSDVSMTNAGAFTVTKIQGNAISSNSPSNDQYLKFSSSSNEWQPVSVLSPDRLTTKGDLLVYNTVDSETRLPVGANGKYLQADSTATNGVAWADIAIADDSITQAKIADDAVGADQLAGNSVVSASIVDGAIVNADINASAAIALSKLASDPSNASNLASGTVPTARLGSGTASSSTFLRGDGAWSSPGSETMGPSFFAYLSADWTIPSEEVWGEIPFDTEVFDSDGCYSTSTYRFTPTTAGKYFVYSNVVIEGSSQGVIYRAGVAIRKNGGAHSISMMDHRGNTYTTATIPATWTVDMNGSSDFLSMYAFYDNSSGTSHVNRSNQGYSGWGAFKIGNT